MSTNAADLVIETGVDREHSREHPTLYRTIRIDGLSIFYREAGPKDAPMLLLLHGLPSSSRMFEPLFARLSRSVSPRRAGLSRLRAQRLAGPEEIRVHVRSHRRGHESLHRGPRPLALHALHAGLRRPGRVPDGPGASGPHRSRSSSRTRWRTTTGLGANWKARRAFWADRAAERERPARESPLARRRRGRATSATIRDVERYDPDLWTDEFAFLSQPGQADIQSDLFYDYRTNVDAYPRWQAWMREKQPRLLVIWGKYDLSFDPSEPEAYRRDVPKAEVHVLDAGHFALDTAADEIAELVRDFNQPSTQSGDRS